MESYGYNSSKFKDLDTRMRDYLGIDGGTGNGVTNTDLFYSGFNRFGNIYPDREISSMLGFVFIVRPDLNLFSEDGKSLLSPYINNDSFFRDLNETHPQILKALTIDHFDSSHHFIPFLMDRVDTYQIADFAVKTNEVATTLATFKVSYPGNANDSMSGDSFDISFREDKDLSITLFFYAWIKYIHGVIRGAYRPKDIYIPNIMDYTTSVYYIVTAPDASTILFFHKRTGTFPYNVPTSNLSLTRPVLKDNTVSISFAGSMPEILNPITMIEFNKNSPGDHEFGEIYDVSKEPYIPIYSGEDFLMSNAMTGSPFIVWDSTDKHYHLRWRPLPSKSPNLSPAKAPVPSAPNTGTLQSTLLGAAAGILNNNK